MVSPFDFAQGRLPRLEKRGDLCGEGDLFLRLSEKDFEPSRIKYGTGSKSPSLGGFFIAGGTPPDPRQRGFAPLEFPFSDTLDAPLLVNS